MSVRAQKEWTSLFTKEIEQIWCEEREEMKCMSMLYCALQNEINRIQNVLSHEVSQIKSDIKRRDFLKKCKKFSGLAQSERFSDIIDIDVNKENETPTTDLLQVPSLFPSPTKSVELVIESPNASANFETPQSIETSPILNKNSFRRKNLSALRASFKYDRSPLKCTLKTNKPQSTLCDDSNILESTIIDDTPDIKPIKRNKFASLQTRKRKKIKTHNNHTLTEKFLAPVKEMEIDIKSPMGITDILNLINESSSETDAGILSDDATVAGLDTSSNNRPKPCFKSFVENFDRLPEKVVDAPTADVVRGKERKKLLGWSCRECEQYYSGLNLPFDELEKKKNECSRHRYKSKPREESFDGFWDLTFGPTPQTPT